ncbi:Endoglucanase [Bienertia sinuspersici]
MARLTLKLIVIFFCAYFCFVEAITRENERLSSQVNYDYKDALSKAILFFEGQRSGKLPSSQRVKWRGDSALSDGNPDNVNLVGGYYDAGDNVKFGWPMSFSTALLSWAAIEFRSEISSANQLDYLRQAIRDGNRDHECWERPEDMDTPRTLYKITSSSPGSEAAADASSACAAASIVFKGVDSAYSSKLLQHAESDELLGAAAWLYKATKSSKYLDYVSNNRGWSQAASEYSWDNKYAGVQVLLAKEYFAGKQMLSEYKSKADSFVCSIMPGSDSARFQTTPGGLLFTRDTANLQYVSSASMILSIYAKTLNEAKISGVQCGSVNIAVSKIRAFTKSQVDYILGENPKKMSYMVGYGDKFPQQVHHRGASIPSISTLSTKVGCNQGYSDWYNRNSPNPNVHVGAIVGGPNSNDEFNDVRSDHTHLEPTTYINAAFVGAVAPLLGPQLSSLRPIINKLNNETTTMTTTIVKVLDKTM